MKESKLSHIEAMRHSAAHLMASAIQELYPDAKFGVGPVVENGFYYDVDLPQALSDKDLAKIEKRMKKIQQRKDDFVREELSINDAVKFFKGKNQPFKVELLNALKEKGSTAIDVEDSFDVDPAAKETTSTYTHGEFIDLCRGPHVENTSKIGPFKLMRVAGAYWRGDEKNPMLQRVYGVAFETQEELDSHLEMLEEAKKRDHRKLGQSLDLFTFSDLVGAGLPLWTPKGTLLRNLLDDFVWELRQARGYERVEIPHITKKELYEISGHWQKFKDELFHIKTREDHEFVMKPMNCPHHTQIYARKKWSYKELPLRYANTTMCYRDEQTGELHGLSRVRSFTQDDAHVFCRYSDIADEMNKVWDIIESFYGAFGFEMQVRLSLHDPNKMDNYLGSAEVWQNAEDQLRNLVSQRKADVVEQLGEAAFYGPKIDFMAKDSLNREWQVATIQLDMNMPEGFDLTCVNESGEPERIAMIHAAIMGSIERFLSITIEHLAGVFPVWLSPVQVKVIPVGEGHREAAQKLGEKLSAKGVRVEVNEADETVGNQIRKAQQEKIPYMIVIGDKEAPQTGDWQDETSLSVKVRGQEDLLELSLSDFIARAGKEIANRKDS